MTIMVIKNQFSYHMTCHLYRTTLPKREPGAYQAFADFFKVGSAGVHKETVGSWEKRLFWNTKVRENTLSGVFGAGEIRNGNWRIFP